MVLFFIIWGFVFNHYILNRNNEVIRDKLFYHYFLFPIFSFDFYFEDYTEVY